MHLLALSVAAAVVACVFLCIARIRASFDASRLIPQVPGLLGGYDNALSFALNPCSFLSRCRQQHGSLYRVSFGLQQLIVVSSSDALSSIISASPQLMRHDLMHKDVLCIVGGATTNYDRLHQVVVHDIMPLIDKCFSPDHLGRSMQGFGLLLLSQIDNLSRGRREPISLTQLTNEPLYAATSLSLFGGAILTDTYADFEALRRSLPYRFVRTLLWRWPSYAARVRLINTIADYLRRGEVVDSNDLFFHGLMKIIKDNDIPSSDGAWLMLNTLWGFHANTLTNAPFLLSFLLCDSDAFARVRAEIDSGIEKFGSLEALLAADASELDDPSFKLLTSAIMETMRLLSMHARVRRANCDFDLKVEGRTVPIKKGEDLLANVQAVHMHPAFFPNPEAFVVDRFAQRPYQRKRLQTDGYQFHSFGGGVHLCRGRWLAIYELKVLMIILFHKFDFSPAGKNSWGWRLLRAHPRSIGIKHTEDDIFVRLSPRQMKAGL